MKKACLALLLIVSQLAHTQTVAVKLAQGLQQINNDPSMRHAIVGFYVVDSKTGKIVIEQYAQTGLAAASTQKLFTSCAAFDILGHDYQYKTTIGYSGTIMGGSLHGNLYINGCGDPSFGSRRWPQTSRSAVLNEITVALQQHDIRNIDGAVLINDSAFSLQPLPGGWIWDDVGNYYGAGTWAINWDENQYDLVLKPGQKEGDPAGINNVPSPLLSTSLVNTITTGPAGSGDNGYIYLPPYSSYAFTQGTVPAGVPNFSISGAAPSGPDYFALELQQNFAAHHISAVKTLELHTEKTAGSTTWPPMQSILFTHVSPPLDSLNYWFLKRSINLYGEALIKTMAFEKNGFGTTEKGVELVKDFWSQHGIEKAALHICDGSGLSPQNRVTAMALVTALQYAKTRPWFTSFYTDLPEYNGMKMKSGSINGARAYAGYHTAKNGQEYTFAIIINNYDGPAGAAVKKMYNLFDVLK